MSVIRKKATPLSGTQDLQPGDQLEALWNRESDGLVMSTGDADLSFKKGDVMVFIQSCPNNWVRVELQGKVGVVPGLGSLG